MVNTQQPTDTTPEPDNDERLRVLVVEPSEQRRTITEENLKQYDFDVYLAEGSGSQIMIDAQQKVMAHYCHVVLVTATAVGTISITHPDTTTIRKRLAPAGVVIYNPQPDDAIAYVAGWHHMGYVRYTDTPQHLAAVVQEHAHKRELRIDWPDTTFQQDLAEILQLPAERLTTQTLRDLLGRVFPRAVGVNLKHLPALAASANAASAVRRAMVLWTQEHRLYTNYLTPKITKIGTRERIEREVRNYHNHVDGQLEQNRQARLEGHSLLWHIGAIGYEFLGASPDEMRTFREYYAENDSTTVLHVLRTLFLKTCHAWYRDSREIVKDASLYEQYNAVLEIDKHLGRLDHSSYRLTFDGVEGDLPNPVLWVLREGHKIKFEQITRCISHGDMHSDNLFVDQSDMAWLIDFEQTGPSHALRDYVELEADIKLRLTPYATDDPAGLVALDRALLASRSLGDMLVPPPPIIQNKPLYKAFQIIAGLRHLAYLATGVSDIREYNQALLYETLFMASMRKLQQAVRARALLSAALITERISARSGLLQPGPAIPRLDSTTLADLPLEEARATMDAHLRSLYPCYQTAQLQQEIYGDQPVSMRLVDGLTLLRQETTRTEAALATLREREAAAEEEARNQRK
jgi:hypothetical protein